MKGGNIFSLELPECRTSHTELNQGCQVCLHLLQRQAALKKYEIRVCRCLGGNIPPEGTSTRFASWSSVQRRRFLKVGIAGRGSGYLQETCCSGQPTFPVCFWFALFLLYRLWLHFLESVCLSDEVIGKDEVGE